MRHTNRVFRVPRQVSREEPVFHDCAPYEERSRTTSWYQRQPRPQSHGSQEIEDHSPRVPRVAQEAVRTSRNNYMPPVRLDSDVTREERVSCYRSVRENDRRDKQAKGND